MFKNVSLALIASLFVSNFIYGCLKVKEGMADIKACVEEEGCTNDSQSRNLDTTEAKVMGSNLQVEIKSDPVEVLRREKIKLVKDILKTIWSIIMRLQYDQANQD